MFNKRALHASALAAAWGLASAAASQTPADIQFHIVNYPRPIVPAVRQIETHFGRVVTYEDVRYVHPSDIVDATAEVSRSSDKTKRVFQMRGGTIVFSHVPRQAPVDDQVEEALRAVIAQSRAAGNTGDFRVERTTGGFHVIPVAALAKTGKVERYVSPLEAPITLASRTHDGVEMMRRLAEAVSAGSGVTVTAGVMPVSRMSRALVTVGARDERARDVLWRALQSIGADLSYELLCGVGENGTCGLSVHRARIAKE